MKKRNKKGFTLIELMIVFSITAIISTIGIVSFVNYSRQATLSNMILDIKNFFYVARTSALNGQKTDCPSGKTLVGHEVIFCCGGGSCPSCLGTGNYEMDLVCSDKINVLEQSKNYPKGVTISSSTNLSFLFYPLSGGVNNTGSVTFSYFGINKTISILANGIIQ